MLRSSSSDNESRNVFTVSLISIVWKSLFIFAGKRDEAGLEGESRINLD